MDVIIYPYPELIASHKITYGCVATLSLWIHVSFAWDGGDI